MRLLPLLIALLIGAAAPAQAQVISGTESDPAERPGDPGRDIESVTSTYDPAGTWTVAVRFYGAPTAETSALLRSFLGVRAQDGACQGASPAILVAVWTDPADRGGKGFVDNHSFDVVKMPDEDGRGFTVTFSDPRLAQRGACGVITTSLSRNEPFDSVGAFEFAGAPARPADPPPPAPGESGRPGADRVPPTARMRILRDPKAARRGLVRVSVLAASEPLVASATLYGPGGRLLSRQGNALRPGQELRLTLPLSRRALRQLRRRGRLAVEVVTLLADPAGNQDLVRSRATLRHRRS